MIYLSSLILRSSNEIRDSNSLIFFESFGLAAFQASGLCLNQVQPQRLTKKSNADCHLFIAQKAMYVSFIQ